jgi:AAA domain
MPRLSDHRARHDHLYNNIKGNVIDSSQLGRNPQDARKLFGTARVIICTLSMLSQPRLAECGLMDDLVPPETLIVDEASQIEISGYITPFLELKTLSRACFVGDDKQCKFSHVLIHLPPIVRLFPMGPISGSPR